MPRPLRLEFEDAWYHVMNRGAGKQDIFKTDNHRMKFLEVVAQTVKLFGVEIHAYCLMKNHYHLLIKTPRGNLSRAMRHINGVYTQHYNRDEKTDGPLFRGRYKAIIVDGDSYLLQVNRYIHLNPVAAKIAKKPEEYHWSSYLDYLRPKNKAPWITVEEIISMISTGNGNERYRLFIEEGLDNETKDFYKRVNTPIIFGKSERKKKLLKKIDEKKIKSSMSDYKQTQELPSLEDISLVCANYFNVKVVDLYRANRGKINEPRKIAIYGSRVWASEKLSHIADLYCCRNHSSISNTVKQVGEKIKKNKKLEKIIDEIRNELAIK
jgi:putative transposase